MTLYEIDSRIEEIIANADPETGEIDFDALESAEMERNAKCENIALALKNYEAEAKAYAAEEKAFKERKQTAERQVKKLKEYLGYALNYEKFKTTKVAVTFRKSEAVAPLTQEQIDMLPDGYKRIKVEPDKTEIKICLQKAPEEERAKLEALGIHLEERKSVTVK